MRFPTVLLMLIIISRFSPPHDVLAAGKSELNVDSFLKRYCIDCHGPQKQESKLRLDQLPVEIATHQHLSLWQRITRRLASGEMPPQGQIQPDDDTRQAIISWAKKSTSIAVTRLPATQSRVRRLNRREYNQTIRDLLHIDITYDPARHFPPDETAHGFDTTSAGLVFSAATMAEVLAAAREAVDRAIEFGPRPDHEIRRLSPAENSRPAYYDEKRGYLMLATATEDGFQRFTPRERTKWKPFQRGRYKIRVHATGMFSDYEGPGEINGPVEMRIRVGPGGEGTGRPRRNIRIFELPDNEPRTYEVAAWFETGDVPIVSFPNGHDGSLKNLVRHRFGDDARKDRRRFFADWNAPHVRVYWVEVEGPIHNDWPPRSSWNFSGQMIKTTAKDVPQILNSFMPRAFRRPIIDYETQPFVNLYQKERKAGEDHEAALKTTIAAVLCDPRFLYHQNEMESALKNLKGDRIATKPPGDFHTQQGFVYLPDALRKALKQRSPNEPRKPNELDDYAIANRLSYFLWSSMPDTNLFINAAAGKLLRVRGSEVQNNRHARREAPSHDYELLAKQVERLLQHRNSEAFVRGFAGQWLEINKLGQMPPDPKRFKTYYDDQLEPAMAEESYSFFRHILKNNLSIKTFLQSDFVFVNENLARHYGITNVKGRPLRLVGLPEEVDRGGLLGQASILTVTSNGTVTSPVVRGAWVMSNILGQTPREPPPNIPAFEPDTRGASTIREQLAKHRSNKSCASCHDKMDPYGFALEAFDPIGTARSRYDNKSKIDTSAELPTGTRITGAFALKQDLLKRHVEFARCLATKLLTYATGRAPTPQDYESIDAIVEKLDPHDGLRDLIILVVTSDAFRR